MQGFALKRLEWEKRRLHLSGSDFELDIRGVRGLIQKGIVPADLDSIVEFGLKNGFIKIEGDQSS